MNEYILKLSIVAIISIHPIGTDSKKIDEKPVDEGKTTEILRGGTINDINISITIEDTIIKIEIKEISHLPITLNIIREDKDIETQSSQNEDKIIFEIDIEKLKVGDVIKIKNKFEDITILKVEE